MKQIRFKNMKKLLAVFVLSLSMLACSSDDNPDLDEGPENGHYKVYVDSNLVAEEEENVSLINGTISVSNSQNFGLLMYNTPVIGQTVNVSYTEWALAVDAGDTSKPMVKLSGTFLGNSNEYSMFSGTITRVSEYKVTFTGVFKELLITGVNHTMEGEIEIKNIISI